MRKLILNTVAAKSARSAHYGLLKVIERQLHYASAALQMNTGSRIAWFVATVSILFIVITALN